MYNQDCTNGELWLTLTFLCQGQIWKNAGKYEFLESFEDFGLKTGTYFCPDEIMERSRSF